MRKNSEPADKSSAENPMLKDENNPDPLISVENLHREVKEWHNEHDTWLQDADQWQREQKL
ncbi:MAG TPA: hypothetical protein ENG96_00620, partial [Gammaproteobacteria bacterium]|nr:hypothetical protein [Gammaproteobacteria bacterium]